MDALERALDELGIKEINTITMFQTDPDILTNDKPLVELEIKLLPTANFLVIGRVRSLVEDAEEVKDFYLETIEPIIYKYLAGMLGEIKKMEEDYFEVRTANTMKEDNRKNHVEKE